MVKEEKEKNAQHTVFLSAQFEIMLEYTIIFFEFSDFL